MAVGPQGWKREVAGKDRGMKDRQNRSVVPGTAPATQNRHTASPHDTLQARVEGAVRERLALLVESGKLRNVGAREVSIPSITLTGNLAEDQIATEVVRAIERSLRENS